MFTKVANDLMIKLAMSPEMKAAFRDNVEFRRAWNKLNVEKGGAASADDLNDLARKFNIKTEATGAGTRSNTGQSSSSRTSSGAGQNSSRTSGGYKGRDDYFKDWANKNGYSYNYTNQNGHHKYDFKQNFGPSSTNYGPSYQANINKSVTRATRMAAAGLGLAGAAGLYGMYRWTRDKNRQK